MFLCHSEFTERKTRIGKRFIILMLSVTSVGYHQTASPNLNIISCHRSNTSFSQPVFLTLEKPSVALWEKSKRCSNSTQMLFWVFIPLFTSLSVDISDCSSETQTVCFQHNSLPAVPYRWLFDVYWVSIVIKLCGVIQARPLSWLAFMQRSLWKCANMSLDLQDEPFSTFCAQCGYSALWFD